MENKETIQTLFAKIINNNCTDEEVAFFLELVRELPADDVLIAELENRWENLVIDQNIHEDEGVRIRERLKVLMDKERSVTPVRPARVHFLKTAWFRYTAAAVFVLGLVGFFWFTNRKSEQSLVNTKPSIKTNIPPGSNKAILTLGDSSTIVLDSAANGVLSVQGNASIVKLEDGQIAYNPKENGRGEVQMNSIVTPRGGQFQLMLADGTKVWLNAASSIEYPSSFPGKTREVRITGEAYFEVAPDKQKPFIVKINADQIEVLGTIFNANAYNDEPLIKTTLLEGSVRIKKENNQQLLKPGQQAQFSTAGTSVKIIDDANIEEAIAWKNGAFDFSDQDIETVMRQIGRWYNVDIVYEGRKPSINIMSVISRNTDLSTVLNSLELVGLHFRIEESKTHGQPGKIIVLQ